MLAANKTGLVSCPRCQSSSDPIERPCLWCAGRGETTELHATEYEVDQLRVRLRLASDDLTRLRNEASLREPVIKAVKAWRDGGCAATGEMAVWLAINEMEDREAALKPQLDAAKRATAAWVAAMAEKGAA